MVGTAENSIVMFRPRVNDLLGVTEDSDRSNVQIAPNPVLNLPATVNNKEQL